MILKHRLDLRGGDAISLVLDGIAGALDELEFPFLVEPHEVAGPVVDLAPDRQVRARRLLRLVPVALQRIGRSDREFADLPLRHRLHRFGIDDDALPRPERPPHHLRRRPLVERAVRYVAHLGGAVHLVDGHAVALIPAVQHFGRAARRRRSSSTGGSSGRTGRSCRSRAASGTGTGRRASRSPCTSGSHRGWRRAPGSGIRTSVFPLLNAVAIAKPLAMMWNRGLTIRIVDVPSTRYFLNTSSFMSRM